MKPSTLATAMVFLFIGIVATGFTRCTYVESPKPTVTTTSTTVMSEPLERIALYWEDTTEPHPERSPWSDHLTLLLRDDLEVYGSAKDITEFCPKWAALDRQQKIKALGELWVAITYHESGFNPDTFYRECNKTKCQYSAGCQIHPTYGYCMKGGHKLDGGIVISRGLVQASLESALAYGCKGLASPQDLHDPIKNLSCANEIMKRQIRNRGQIAASSNYWAVLKTGGGFNKLSDIKARVLKHAASCQ